MEEQAISPMKETSGSEGGIVPVTMGFCELQRMAITLKLPIQQGFHPTKFQGNFECPGTCIDKCKHPVLLGTISETSTKGCMEHLAESSVYPLDYSGKWKRWVCMYNMCMYVDTTLCKAYCTDVERSIALTLGSF